MSRRSAGRNLNRLPRGDWTDPATSTVWKLIWSEDFDIDTPGANVAAATGIANWRPVAPSALPVANPYSGKIGCYERPIADTYNQGRYYSERTTWIENSCLVINCHAEVIPETGVLTPLSGTFAPITTTFLKDYCRVVYRYRAVTNVAPGVASRYGGVWQWINSGQWPAYGEWDFPEADLNGNVQGFQHFANGAGGQATVTVASPAIPVTSWVTAEQLWEPAAAGAGHLVFKANGRTALDTTAQVNPPSVTGVKSFNFQCGTHVSGSPPDVTTTARIEIAYVAVYAHPSSNSYSDTPRPSL
jgi:hypothetical protein